VLLILDGRTMHSKNLEAVETLVKWSHTIAVAISIMQCETEQEGPHTTQLQRKYYVIRLNVCFLLFTDFEEACYREDEPAHCSNHV
jgi:hypothetical protein